MSAESWGESGLLVVCVLVSALSSATETALTSVNRLRVRHLADEGGREASVLQRLQADPNRFLSTVLVVNTVALILASFATTVLALRFLPPAVGFVGDLGISLALSVFLLIFAEVTPKSLAIRHAERIALLAAGPVEALSRLLRPVLWFITLVARAITGGRGSRSVYLTEPELMTLLHVSEEQGVIEEKETEMISGIIEIGDKSVREVMVPRTDISAIERGATVEEIVRLFREERHTRVPVYEGDLDHIVGLIHVKDLLLFFSRGSRAGFDLQKIMRPIRYTPESKKVDELLHQMQTERVHMIVVVDEYGGTAGLVTLEDLLEEIVGEIQDEYDIEEEPLRILGPREAQVDARYPMADLNDELQLGVEESAEYDSVGGYVYATLGEVPEAGATFDAGRVRWTVELVNGRRIVRVRLRAEEPWPDEVLVEAGLAGRPQGGPGPGRPPSTHPPADPPVGFPGFAP